MTSSTESRRVTVSCKNLHSSTANDRSTSTLPPRRFVHNNSNMKRNNGNNNPRNTFVRTSNNSTKSPKKPIDSQKFNVTKSNVFLLPFSIEYINDNEQQAFSPIHNKSCRTSLNPLSPAFFSKQQTPLLLEQNQDTLSSGIKVSLPVETSDYSSGTDLEFQTIQHMSPQTNSSRFTFDFDEPPISYSIDNINNQTSSSNRRASLSSSSSSSSSTSPSSSISNLSSLSSSSELKNAYNSNNQNRSSNKKTPSVNNNNNHNASNDMSTCQCEKESFSCRKRNRLNVHSLRRYATLNYCENCQAKRIKCNSRTKSYSNRQQKQRFNNGYYNSTKPVKFSVDLTGLNIDYTIEYHDNIKCTCSTTPPLYTSTYSSCRKCLLMNDWSSYAMTNSMNDYNNELYYVNGYSDSWIQQTHSLYDYHDLYLTKLNTRHLSSIYFDDSSILDAMEYVPPYYFRNILPTIERESVQPPPTRSWLRLASPNTTQSTAIFTVMNYNILCDKYATRHVYGYCPSWALKWEYRRNQILDELRSYAADIIALQEIETDQFHLYFLPELQKVGYDGVFSPKSRARTMCEQDRRFVDGCAIFYRQSKFRLIKDYLVEFNQLAMLAANGASCHEMMNRVMTKDNIGLVALLETKEEIYSHTFANGISPSEHPKQLVFVCTAHIHWDPEYCDVKVIQTLMLLSELKTIMEDAMKKYRKTSIQPFESTSVPLVLCGDFNSLPESGVIEFMRNGKISMNHADFKDLSYQSYLQKITRADANSVQSTDITHQFKLQSAYETTSSPIMPYTNYTYDFKGIIDYVFFSSDLMRVLGVLGPLDPEWLQSNKIVGCPHPNVPSDHFSLLVEFELDPTISESSNNNNSKTSTAIPIASAATATATTTTTTSARR